MRKDIGDRKPVLIHPSRTFPLPVFDPHYMVWEPGVGRTLSTRGVGPYMKI